MEKTTRLYSSLYDKLYWKYKDEGNPKFALFVKKYFLLEKKDTRNLMEEMGFATDRSVRRIKAIVNKDLLILAKLSKDVYVPPELQ
jgi:hypothetical protein